MIVTEALVETVGDALWDQRGRPEGERWECWDEASDVLEVLADIGYVVVRPGVDVEL